MLSDSGSATESLTDLGVILRMSISEGGLVGSTKQMKIEYNTEKCCDNGKRYNRENLT